MCFVSSLSATPAVGSMLGIDCGRYLTDNLINEIEARCGTQRRSSVDTVLFMEYVCAICECVGDRGWRMLFP